MPESYSVSCGHLLIGSLCTCMKMISTTTVVPYHALSVDVAMQNDIVYIDSGLSPWVRAAVEVISASR